MENTQNLTTGQAPVVPPRPPSPVELTEKALEMVKSTMDRESLSDSGLRVAVVGGGCSGFQYSLDLEKEARAGDMTFEYQGLQLFIDPMSAQYLRGVTVDYVETLHGAGFSFSNPNAKATCGCGSSFAV